MKIGINASFVRKSGTGIGQVTLNVLRALSNFEFSNLDKDRKNNKIEFILYLEEDLSDDIDLSKNFKKRIFLPPYKRDDLIRKIWWEKFCLPKKVEQDRCDIFLSLYQNPTILSSRAKHIMIVHDIIPKLFPEYLGNWRKKIYWKLTERAIKRADKIIAVSKHTKNDLIKYLEILAKKITVNYIDVDPIYKQTISKKEGDRILKKYNLETGYIYSGGGLEKRKNMETLLKAYKALIKHQLPDAKYQIPTLVISGKLMPELSPLITDVEKLVKKLDLEDKVKLLDFVPQEDLPSLYKNAKMFVYPSLYEGFGLPVLEAMNCGTPVICSNVSSLSEVGGGAVEYFNLENKNELTAKIKNVLEDKNLHLELSEKGQKQAQNFSWEKFVKNIF